MLTQEKVEIIINQLIIDNTHPEIKETIQKEIAIFSEATNKMAPHYVGEYFKAGDNFQDVISFIATVLCMGYFIRKGEVQMDIEELYRKNKENSDEKNIPK